MMSKSLYLPLLFLLRPALEPILPEPLQRASPQLLEQPLQAVPTIRRVLAE